MTYREIPTTTSCCLRKMQSRLRRNRSGADRGEMFISYGSDERIDGFYHVIDWDEDGLHYSIGAQMTAIGTQMTSLQLRKMS